jgi:uncharacterized phage protein (TIGR01671 family)
MVEVTAFFFIGRSVTVRWNDTEDTQYNLSLDDCVLFEYTGLKDKKEKEIYEGNLLRVGECGTYEVKWRCGAFFVERQLHLDFGDKDYGWDFSVMCDTDEFNGDDTMNDTEIIGDIYSNPELITRACLQTLILPLSS